MCKIFGKINHSFVIRKYSKPCLTWENFDQQVKHNSLFNFYSNKVFPHGLVSENNSILKKLSGIKKLIKDFDLGNQASIHVYCAYTNKHVTPKHSDDMNVLFWQQIGQTLWIIQDSKYVLWPGDAIYIPKHTAHRVISLTARIGISMGDG